MHKYCTAKKTTDILHPPEINQNQMYDMDKPRTSHATYNNVWPCCVGMLVLIQDLYPGCYPAVSPLAAADY